MHPKSKPVIRVWDLPTRLFHWLLATCVIGAFVTVKSGNPLWMEWHIKFGIVALALIAFRIIWGFVGPRYARFTQFIKSPATVRQYISGNLPALPGHNPLGGWSVIAMLLAVGIQAFTGLFVSDDILYQGPFYNDVSGPTATIMRTIHGINEYVILFLVGLHLLAIILYTIRGKKLISGMVTGDMPVALFEPDSKPARDGLFVRLWALAIAVACGFCAWWLIVRATSSGMSF